MFKGLTQRAQRVLTVLAQEEAKRFHSDQLQPEHVVLALSLRAGARKLLVLQDFDIAEIKTKKVSEILKEAPLPPVAGLSSPLTQELWGGNSGAMKELYDLQGGYTKVKAFEAGFHHAALVVLAALVAAPVAQVDFHSGDVIAESAQGALHYASDLCSQRLVTFDIVTGVYLNLHGVLLL